MTKTRTKGPKAKCVLCKVAVAPTEYEGLFLHPVSDACQVAVTDNLGLSLDDTHVVIDGAVYERANESTDDVAISGDVGVADATGAMFIVDGIPIGGSLLSSFTPVEEAIAQLFAHAGLPVLGGASGTRGWSSISTFQRCRYLWRLKYGGGSKDVIPAGAGPLALEMGHLVHLFTGLRYQRRIDPSYPIAPEQARTFLEGANVEPQRLGEAWALFDGYCAFWGDESWMTPLAVEELAVDPRTGFSCRWDLVFRVDFPYENLLPGVYVCNTKTARDNGMVTREQWKNDGQILGEIDLYERLGYHRRWGALRAACINLVVKTKVPQYDRIWVYPPRHILRDHHKSLKIWDAEMKVAEATGVYPRSRASCITRHHTLCEMFEHCSGANDADREIE